MLKTPKEKSHKKEFYKGLLDKNKELRYPAKHSVKLKQKANVEKIKWLSFSKEKACKNN